jgi:MYXO-CTERM domain-containing protein
MRTILVAAEMASVREVRTMHRILLTLVVLGAASSAGTALGAIKFGDVGGTKDFFEGGRQEDKYSITFLVELAAVNRDDGLETTALLEILKAVLLQSTVDKVAAGAEAGLAILKLTLDGTAISPGTLNFKIESNKPNELITGIDISWSGMFITEVDDLLWINWGKGVANVAGTATLGATAGVLKFSPAEHDGTVVGGTDYEEPKPVAFTGSLSLDLPQPMQSTVFTSSVTLTATNSGSTDTFSAATLQSFSAVVRTVKHDPIPEPSAALLWLGLGALGLIAGVRRRWKVRTRAIASQ